MAGNGIIPRPISDSMSNATSGSSFANNKPVGSAGQPMSGRSGAIARRMSAVSQSRPAMRKSGNL